MPFIRQDKPLQEVFSLTTPHHMLNKLYWEAKQFRNACDDRSDDIYAYPNAGYIAFNCAVTALHCADWAWSAAEPDTRRELGNKLGFRVKGNKGDVIAFSDALEKLNRDFYICRQIANGSKHMRRGDRNHAVEVSVECSPRTAVEGRYLVDFVIRDGDKQELATAVFDRICEFWYKLYQDLGYSEGEFIC